MPDETPVVIRLANRSRIWARVGGLKAEEIKAFDGPR